MADIAARADFYIGEQASLTRTITEADVNTFAALTGDVNPIHVDKEYASKSRFGRRVAHGTLTGGLIGAVLANRLPGPGAIYLSQQLEFVAPVFLGDTVTAVVEVTSWRPEKRIITLKTAAYNQEDRQVVTGQSVLLVE